jgi:DHA1 family chloramphenicol resistance protein-like MFS transporter
MPLAVYILGLAIFAQGTSELMLAGLLPQLSSDLDVSIPATGLLISGFAVGMIVGAPVLAVATRRWSRRTALLTFLAVYVATHVVAALTSSYAVLLVTRVVGAFVYAGFWAIATLTAVALVPPNARGKAMGIVAGGLTLAMLVGLPGGTLIGDHLGWRAAFWTVAAMSALTAIGVLTKIPGGRPDPDQLAPLRHELRVLADRRLWLTYGTTALATGSLLVSFGYLAPLLIETTGIEEGIVPAVLAIYGLGALIGIGLGGRVADAHPFTTLYVGIAGLVVTSIAIALLAQHPLPTLALVFLLGAFGFGTNPTLNSRVFAIVEGPPALAASGTVVAFNVGIAVGPWLGGLAIGAGLGYPSVAWIGAGLGVLALAAVALTAAAQRSRAGTPRPRPTADRTAAVTTRPSRPR